MNRFVSMLAWSIALGACAANTPGSAGQCSAVRCNPPTCCGNACSADADCCRGTLCLASGRCGPALCAGCSLGCRVDFAACTAECNAPARCNDDCTSDADCAAGTHCAATVTGLMHCFPDSCGACGGLHAFCQPHPDCTSECIAPPTCAQPCATSADCGASSECHTFVGGQLLCVPVAFQEECNACGAGGCQLHSADCTVICPPPLATDAGPLPDAGPPTFDAGPVATSDASVAPPSDGGAPPPADAGPACRECCGTCATDADCCSGHCGRNGAGTMICIPPECAACSFGCTFHCPT